MVSDTIGANLLASGFDIVDRTHMARLLEEKDISYLEVNSPDYEKIGDITNVRFVLVGNIAFSSATARVVDVSNGETVIITIFQPNKIIGSASAVDIGDSLAKSLGKKLAKGTEL